MSSQKKPLPKVESPLITATFPISKKKVTYRPFVSKEQKSLLIAQNSEDAQTIYSTISAVVESCTNGTADVDSLAYGDLSWLFLKISNASTGPEHVVSLKCSDEDCRHEFLMNVDLDLVQVKNANFDPVVMISNTIGIKMRIPTYSDLIFIESNIDDVDAIIYHLVEQVFDEEQVYLKSDYTREEFIDWLGSFTDEQLMKFDQFVSDIPDLSHTFEYSCPKCGKQYSKPVEGLLGFFRVKSGQL